MAMRSVPAGWAILAILLVGAAPRTIFASSAWVAFDRGASCEATARSDRIVTRLLEQAHAAFVFDRQGTRRGQFAAKLSRPVRPGASVMLTIGDRPFLLAARDRFVWSKGPLQESAIIGAARFASGMRIEARSTGGERFVDGYQLAGVAGAIDAAAACSTRRG
ncbi:MAG: hypothetical protein M3N02_02330 [Pseudomonadota bacterium]|nr:hypothetical protein [Pseudomonadota bacterium]